MKLSDFNYNYPDDLVAQRPLPSRDASRMMVVDRKNGTVCHSRVAELHNFLRKDDLLVINDSRVIPARLFGLRGNGKKIELLVVEPAQKKPGTWRCMLKGSRRVRSGEKIFFGMHATAKVCGHEDALLLVEFKNNALELAIKHHGVPPLPPYIKRDGIEAYTDEDRERYQTVYADKPGSAAAPTAGLHLSKELLAHFENRGINIASITLHVGIDTFAPVRTEDIKQHRMHGERVEISPEASEKIARAKSAGQRVVAVGTTTVRAIESAARQDAKIAFGNWNTDLFIVPGYRFKVVDAMLTNFHQPRSTLLMMVSAFAGRELIMRCYEEAIRERYRLFSYGDCMLIV